MADEGLKTQGLVEDTLGALYKNKAWAYIGKKEPAKAIPLLQKSISIYPNRADVYCLMSKAKADLKQPVINVEELKNCFHTKSDMLDKADAR